MSMEAYIANPYNMTNMTKDLRMVLRSLSPLRNPEEPLFLGNSSGMWSWKFWRNSDAIGLTADDDPVHPLENQRLVHLNIAPIEKENHLNHPPPWLWVQNSSIFRGSCYVRPMGPGPWRIHADTLYICLHEWLIFCELDPMEIYHQTTMFFFFQASNKQI